MIQDAEIEDELQLMEAIVDEEEEDYDKGDTDVDLEVEVEEVVLMNKPPFLSAEEQAINVPRDIMHLLDQYAHRIWVHHTTNEKN